MVLAAHSDASYLTEPGSRSRAGAHIFLSENDPVPWHNTPVLTISQIIKYVMASAAKAELAALYITARKLIPLRNALVEMGWTQPKTPIQTDNSTATGFVNDTIIQRRIKMIWMQSLAPMPRSPMAIPLLLGSCICQLGRLQYKAPLTCISPGAPPHACRVGP
eukprot:CCRYP_001364-RB/>CCRYP_001364-RB protein AED:0.44 eAED:0.59 QI:0/-1/0/1/-1/0/1/0/162